MPMEVEIKLRIPDARTATRIWEDNRIAAHMMTPFREIEMEAVYYDTADRLLQTRHWSFRIRREGERTVAACKTSESKDGSLFSRREWEVLAETPQQALPLLVEAGAPQELLSLGEMLPQCRICFTRTAAPLQLPNHDTAVEIVVDNGELEADGKKEHVLELELELLAGQLEEMQNLAEYLEKKYLLQAEHLSKYARALRLIRSRQTSNAPNAPNG